MPGPAHTDAPALDEVLHLADPDGPSRCAEPALTRDRAFARIGTPQLTEKKEYLKKCPETPDRGNPT